MAHVDYPGRGVEPRCKECQLVAGVCHLAHKMPLFPKFASKDHPECAYNCANSAHLRPAYVLDRALNQFSREIGEGKWTSEGIPADIRHDTHLSVGGGAFPWINRKVPMGRLFGMLSLQKCFPPFDCTSFFKPT